MAKLLISCDNSLFEKDGLFFYKDAEWADFYARYLRVFEEIRIVNRVTKENDIPSKRVRIDDSRVEVIPVPVFSGPIQYAKHYFEIGSIIKNAVQGCDAAIFRLPSTIAQRICKKAILSGIPYAIEVVFDAEDMWRSEKGVISKLLWKRIDKDMRMSCYQADGVSCVTEKYLQNHYYSKKPNSFTSYYSTLALQKSFYLHSRSFPKHQPLVLANIANQIQFDGRKGFNEIIEALAVLKNRGLIVYAKFVGESYHDGISKFERYAEQLGVKQQISYTGYLSREGIDKFLNQVDMFVMPTRAEGLPRVIIEAMAKGLPCITTPVSGNPELINQRFLVAYENVELLANKIEELIKNPSVYEDASKENFQRSLKYEASILEGRRDAFYWKLKKCVKAKWNS